MDHWTAQDTIPLAGAAATALLHLSSAQDIVTIAVGVATLVYTLMRMYYLVKHKHDRQ